MDLFAPIEICTLTESYLCQGTRYMIFSSKRLNLFKNGLYESLPFNFL